MIEHCRQRLPHLLMLEELLELPPIRSVLVLDEATNELIVQFSILFKALIYYALLHYSQKIFIASLNTLRLYITSLFHIACPPFVTFAFLITCVWPPLAMGYQELVFKIIFLAYILLKFFPHQLLLPGELVPEKVVFSVGDCGER